MEENNIQLKQLKKEDISVLNELRNDWENKKMTLGVRFPITLETDEEWYDKICSDHSNKNVFFAIKDTLADKTIGIIQLSNIDWVNRNTYIGIQILKNEIGKGYGNRSIDLATSYAFNVLNLRKVIAEIVAINIDSKHVFEKCGYVVEGKLNEHIYYDSQYHDLHIMAKIKK